VSRDCFSTVALTLPFMQPLSSKGGALEQSGEYEIGASRDQVWAALNDPDVLGACIAGCQNVDKIDAEHFDVSVKARIGPVSAKFQAALELKDLNPPASYVIEGSAKGGAAGFAKGSATVRLDELETGGTLLRYGVKANVGGKLAQIGSRLVDGAARKMADDFFAEFSKRLDPQAAVAVDEPAVVEGNSFEESGQWKIWAIAFSVLILAAVLAI
jgi:carbon monoxide dehydrogenase subunit G